MKKNNQNDKELEYPKTNEVKIPDLAVLRRVLRGESTEVLSPERITLADCIGDIHFRLEHGMKIDMQYVVETYQMAQELETMLSEVLDTEIVLSSEDKTVRCKIISPLRKMSKFFALDELELARLGCPIKLADFFRHKKENENAD